MGGEVSMASVGKHSDPWLDLGETRIGEAAPAKRLGALVDLAVEPSDLDDATTLDMRGARSKELRAMRRCGGTVVMPRPLGLAPLARANVPPPSSRPRSGERAGLVAALGPRLDLDAPAAPLTAPFPFDRRILWIVSALLLALVGVRAVPFAAARLGSVVSTLSTHADP
jgi:hypothetical protein